MNLIDQFKQTWSTSSVDNSPKALNYRLYQKGVSFENYLEILKDTVERLVLSAEIYP